MEVTKHNRESRTYSARDKVRAVLAALVSAWPNAGSDDSDATGVWSNAVHDLTENQLRHGIDCMSKYDSAFPLSPGQFRALAVSYKTPARVEAKRIVDRSERGIAKKQVNVMFARRLCGPEFTELVPTVLKRKIYSGDFDCAMVANAIPVDGVGTSHAEHKAVWRKLHTLFNEEWALYEKRGA